MFAPARPRLGFVDEITLRNGLEVTIRPIRREDAGNLQEAFERLTPESRYRRFLAAKTALSEGDVRYFTQIDGRRHVALVATPANAPERIIAVARYIHYRDDPASAEFSIVVEDAFQGIGLGGALLSRLADSAIANGIERFTALTLTDNLAAHRLFQRLSRKLPHRRIDGPVEELVYELAA
jgi:RimJ/RimL family protein N-acetyltransferase